MNLKFIWILLVLIIKLNTIFSFSLENQFLKDFILKLVRTRYVILFHCNDLESIKTTKLLISFDQFVTSINIIRKNDLNLKRILTMEIYTQPLIVLNCSCPASDKITEKISELKGFNTSYQWLMYGDEKYLYSAIIGPNAQLTYVNKSRNNELLLFNVHSKGRHLKAPLEFRKFNKWSKDNGFENNLILQEIQSIRHRSNFNGLKLRGGTVIDIDNITTNSQVDQLLSDPQKKDGITTFTKYYYALSKLLSEELNFTIDYRITRTWLGNVKNTTHRAGFFGILLRNEIDIGATASRQILSRIALYDTIHQSYYYESGFIYLYSPILKTSENGGDFLAPFEYPVWLVSGIAFIVMIIMWKLFILITVKYHLADNDDIIDDIALQSFAVMCQQGLDTVPKNYTTRMVAMTLILFSFLMYNYYTSSVVGGLLSKNDGGPKSLQQIIDSPLTVAFEDIAYLRMLFTTPESQLKSPKTAQKLVNKKIKPRRKPNEIPVYTTVPEAVPFIQQGTSAFHCELIDAYDLIAKSFSVEEICNIRTIKGPLLDIEVVNMVLSKNHQYTEIFKTVLTRFREVGGVKRESRKIKADRPECLGDFIVYPVEMGRLFSAFCILGGGMVLAIIFLMLEVLVAKIKDGREHKKIAYLN